MGNGISRQGSVYGRDIVGVYRIILQPKQDRGLFIKHCYQTSTVSILSKVNLDVIHDVDIDTSSLQKIQFPDTPEQLGSTVIAVNLPVYNKPVVIAVLTNKDDMSTMVEENQFSFVRRGVNGSVNISGKASNGSINIYASSNSNKGGHLRINVSNRNGTAKMDVVVNGDFFLTTNTSNIRVRDSYDLVVNDGKEGSKDTFHRLNADEVESRVKNSTSGFKFEEKQGEIGDGSDNAVLANILEKFTHELIDVIAAQTTVTSLGPQPLVNAAGISAMKAKTKDWISTYLKIQ